MMYKAKLTLSSESHTKHINANVISMQSFCMFNPFVREVTGRI